MTSEAIYNEIDTFAADWLAELVARGHVGPGIVERRSIADLAPADVAGPGQRHFFAGIGVWSYALRLAGVPDDADVWTGSCPCQPFSGAGKRRGTDDERHLWPAWFRLIRECRPPVVFGEQVASPDGLAWLDAVSSDLEGAGYAVGAADLCAAGVGAPHIRQRLYFVAYARGERREGQRLLVRERRPQQGVPEARWGGETRELADSDDARPQGWRERRDGADERAARSGGVARELADAEEVGRGPRRAGEAQLPGERRRRAFELGGSRDARGMGDSGRDGDREHAGELHGDEAANGAHGDHTPIDAGASRAPWRDVEWIPCSDGKARPVEPGTFPLAHGAPRRVGRLRGYGNAIVAELAATFIEAAREAIDQRG